jgi:transcriptional regulator with GAF, ATPase, and Fis domain
MATLILTSEKRPGEQRVSVRKKVTTVGSDPGHDIQAGTQGLLFTLMHGERGHELVPADARVLVNGQVVRRTTGLKPCDRIEWAGGVGLYLAADLAPGSGATEAGVSALRSLGVLQNLAATLQSPGSLQAAFHQALDALVEMSGAEAGYLLSDLGRDGWELVASQQDPSVSQAAKRKELFSNTILQEALVRREPVHVENIIGHPWAEAASVIEARIFSAACFPLCVGDRTLGAVFLLTRSPGRSIKRESLPELSLMAAQAALMLGTEAELNRARRENARLRALVADDGVVSLAGPVTGASAAESAGPMPEVARKLAKLAPTPLSVLVLGETGTGKEVAARELHRQSPRAAKPFVAINCAAIPATLLESTLFGHERGAFTGAVRAQPGKFAQADGGTLFLDEIGDLPLELQAKLLRVLQERQVEPLGASKPVAVDVRVVAATHQDIDAAVRAGRFRQDLYFRLNGATLRLPPLRERGSADLMRLAEHFLRKAGSPARFSAEALRAMEAHPWPGNVRELEQLVTRAALLSEGDEISVADLDLAPAALREHGMLPSNLASDLPSNLQDAQLAFTQDFAARALERHGGSRSLAAAELGISERTLYRIIASAGAPDGVGRGV